MAVLGDERLFALLERDGDAIARGTRRPSTSGAVAELVERAMWAKVEVVLADEREQGADAAAGSPSTSATRWATPSRRRRATTALLHGEAVAYGLRAALPDRRSMGVTPPERADRVGATARPPRAGCRPLPYPIDTVLGTSRDRQEARGGRLRWVLPTADGVVVRSDVPDAIVASRGRRAARAGVTGGAGPMTRVLVLQGPNLNLLGTRQPEIYGRATLDQIHAAIARAPTSSASRVEFFQSNHEGALIDRLHARDFDVAIVNAGGLTHTSVALRDALLSIERPFIEVHLSDPATREPFRQVNFLHDIALESIVGQGARGYHLAIDAIARRVETGELPR